MNSSKGSFNNNANANNNNQEENKEIQNTIPNDKKPPKPLVKSGSGLEKEKETKRQFYQVKERKNYFDNSLGDNFSG